MPYQNLEIGTLGLSPEAVRMMLPDVSFADGADLTEQGFLFYSRTDAPAAEWYERVVEVAPVNGEQAWQIIERDDALASLKAERLNALAERRKAAVKDFSFGGMPMVLDKDTEDAIGKCKQGLEDRLALEPTPQIDYEIARGVFIVMDLPTITALGRASFAHVQACFSVVKAKTTAILAAVDLDALVEVDINSGWPT